MRKIHIYPSLKDKKLIKTIKKKTKYDFISNLTSLLVEFFQSDDLVKSLLICLHPKI